MRAMSRKRNTGTASTSEIGTEESLSSDDDHHLETVNACKLLYNWFLFHLQSENHKHARVQPGTVEKNQHQLQVLPQGYNLRLSHI